MDIDMLKKFSIIRNGEQIELTEQEVVECFQSYEMYCNLMDIKNELQDRIKNKDLYKIFQEPQINYYKSVLESDEQLLLIYAAFKKLHTMGTEYGKTIFDAICIGYDYNNLQKWGKAKQRIVFGNHTVKYTTTKIKHISK